MPRPLVIVMLGLVLSFTSPHAQTKRPMTLVDLLNIPRVSVSAPDITRDGRQLIFTLVTVDWPNNTRIPQIWTVNADGTGLHRLTSAEGGATGGQFSPDGSSVAYLSRGAIFLMPSNGGSPRQLSRHATPISPQFAWQPDGSAIYFIATDPPTDAERERAKRRGDVRVLDEFRQRHLWKIAVADGKEQRLTSGSYSITDFAIGANGRLAVMRGPDPTPPSAELREVWALNPDGTGAVQLTRNNLQEDQPAVSPDGSQVLFLARANDRQEPYYNANVFVVSTAGGASHAVIPDFKYEVLRAAWSQDGKSIWALVNMGVHTELFQMNVATRAARQLTNGEHQITPFWNVVADRQAFVVDEPTRIGDIWTFAPDSKAAKRVTGIYDYLDRDFQLPRQERIEWKGADGTSVEGLLTYPLDYKPGTRYPLIVQLHGGPEDSDRFGWGIIYLNYQPVWAAKGYAILRPNYRGSSGYGNAFYREPVGGYFKNSHLDVLAGVDRVVAMGIADPNQLGVMGWSAGAHLVNKLITFTDRFKAASSYAGVANWISLYGESDTRGNRDLWLGGTLWQKNAPIQTYWDQSPLKYISSARTPTIFFIGSEDSRVPMAQSVEMSRALKAQNVATELHVFPDEDHQWRIPAHFLYKMNAELDWFDKYVRRLPYTWEALPSQNDTKVVPAP